MFDFSSLCELRTFLVNWVIQYDTNNLFYSCNKNGFYLALLYLKSQVEAYLFLSTQLNLIDRSSIELIKCQNGSEYKFLKYIQ